MSRRRHIPEYRSSSRLRGGFTRAPESQSPSPIGRIPDDHALICTIVAAYISAPDRQMTFGELHDGVVEILIGQGFSSDGINIAFNRMTLAYAEGR